MKKLLTLFLILIVTIGTTGCSDYRDKDKLENRSVTCQQPGSFFPEGELRYILVDESVQKLGYRDYHCYIYADRYTHIMYGYYVTAESGSYEFNAFMIQLEYEDGSPMLFDDGVW